MQIQSSGNYLDFRKGLDGLTGAWDKAAKKGEERTQSWSAKSLGLQFSAMVCNLFCSSVLSFLGQLLDVPKESLDKGEQCVLKLAAGPYGWAYVTDLWIMGKQLGTG